MKMSFVSISIFLIAFIAHLSHQTAFVGAWQKDSFEKNDLYIDRSRSLSVKEIFAQHYQNKNEDDLFDYPLEVYRKIVNGFRFKIFFAVHDKSTNGISFYSTLVSSGPFSDRTPAFNVENVEMMKPQNQLKNDKTTLTKIRQAVDKYAANTQNNSSEVKVLSQYGLSEIASAWFYLVKVDNKTTYVVFEEKEAFSVNFELR